MRGDLVKRLVTGMNASVAASTWTSITLQVPVDVTSGLGIQIWGWDFEIMGTTLTTTETFLVTTHKSLQVILSRSPVTVEKFMSDNDVIDKYKHVTALVGAVVSFSVEPLVFHRDIYPAYPYFSNVIYCSVYHDAAVALSVYVRVWYSAVMLSRDELMGMLTNFGVP